MDALWLVAAWHSQALIGCHSSSGSKLQAKLRKPVVGAALNLSSRYSTSTLTTVHVIAKSSKENKAMQGKVCQLVSPLWMQKITNILYEKLLLLLKLYLAMFIVQCSASPSLFIAQYLDAATWNPHCINRKLSVQPVDIVWRALHCTVDWHSSEQITSAI